MNTRSFFCQHLADWFYQVDWHYSTLLEITIDCVRELPDDADQLINELLLRYPSKPSINTITEFLLESHRLFVWFRYSNLPPAITHFNLDNCHTTELNDIKLPRLETSGDLADWLEVTMPQLDWFADLWRLDRSTPAHLKHYRYQLLKKRSGNVRVIEQPKSTLKRMQRLINTQILSSLQIHSAAHGFIAGRNCQTHASLHIGRQYLFMFDISDCFHSIGWPQVKVAFLNLGYSPSVSTYLSAICTHRVNPETKFLTHLEHRQRDLILQRHLPQGAPTSPALANAALFKLDKRLTGLARSLNLNYSRYADDLAMSGDKQRDWRFLEPLVGAICREEGLSLNFRKSKIKRPHQKQKLVGVVVNEKLNVDRTYYHQLKATLTNCARHGVANQNHDGHKNFRAHLLGCVQHVKSLNESKGAKLESIYRTIRFED